MKSKFKILHLHSGVGDSGGIASYISNLLKMPSPENLKIFVTGSNKKRKKVINSKLFNHSNIIFIDIDRYNLLSLLSNVKKLSKIIKENSINLVHAHALRSGLLACINRIFFSTKYVYTNHGLRFTQKKFFIKKIFFFFYEIIIIVFSNYAFCIREIDYKKLKYSPFYFIFKHKLRLVKTKLKLPSYCSIKKFSKRKTIIGIGSLIEVKRPFIFLNLISEIHKINKNIDAIWIGEGNLKNELIEINKEIKAPINWVGHVNRNQVKKYLEISSLTLLTSEFEVFPLSIIESYWGGVPVISYRFFGVEEFIQNGKTGLIYKSNDNNFKIFAKQINTFISDDRKLSEMSKYVTNYFWENLYDYGKSYNLYFTIYNSIARIKV